MRTYEHPPTANIRDGRKVRLSMLAGAGAVLSLLTACGSEEEEGVTLTFDDLGGGSSIIEVYPGVTDTPEHKLANGTYEDGDTVPAECKVPGRDVSSVTGVGEEDRTSSDWVLIHGTPGETQYATAVYVENPEELLSQLRECKLPKA